MVDNPPPNNRSGLIKWRQDSMERTLDALTKRVETLEKELITTRLERERLINSAKEEVDKKLDNLKDETIKPLEIEVAKINTRLTIFQGIQATFTTVAGAIAALVGRI